MLLSTRFVKELPQCTIRQAILHACTAAPVPGQARKFSVLNRPPPNYEGHVPLNAIEKGALAVGSAVMSLINPRRGDLIATLGETTATPYFIYRLRDRMLGSGTGRRILRDRPRITSKTMSLEYLRGLPENSVGRTYAAWLDREGVGPDTRTAVRYIDDEECAYVMQRYRECHDFYHALTGLPVFVEGEVALKAFEFANTLLPMTGLSLFAITKLSKPRRDRLWQVYLPWAFENGRKCKDIINIYWEEELETDVDELRKRLGLEKPPDLREARRKAAMEKRLQENHSGQSKYPPLHFGSASSTYSISKVVQIIIVPAALTPAYDDVSSAFVFAGVFRQRTQKLLELVLSHFAPQLAGPSHHDEPVLDICSARLLDEAYAAKAICCLGLEDLGEDVGTGFG